MSEVVAFGKQPGVTYLIHWIIMDTNACRKCQILGTRTFDQNNLEGSWLVDREFGPVWDLANESSMVHPNCRCTLDIEPEINPDEFVVGEMGTITEIKQQIADLETKVSSFSMSYHEVRELETILMRTLIVLERSTGSKEVAEAINRIQRLITIIRMAQFTIHAFQMASGPIGWAFAASGLLMTAITTGDAMVELRAH